MVKRGHRGYGPQASEGEAQHGPFCWIGRLGHDTSVCIVDDAGKIVREVKGGERAGSVVGSAQEAGLSLQADWIGSRTAGAVAVQRSRRSRVTGGLCRDAAHAGGPEGADNKTDRNDARGIAQMMRAGLYRPVHVKTLRSQKLRMLLTHRWP
jgi:transposase